jgi:hypothetical protein
MGCLNITPRFLYGAIAENWLCFIRPLIKGEVKMDIKNMEEFGKAIDDNQHIEYQSMVGWKTFDKDWLVVDIANEVSEGRVRIRPEFKKIDLAILINSGIDCEFSYDVEQWFVAPLTHIERQFYEAKGGTAFEYCRPRMNHWMSWENVPEDKSNDIERWLSEHFEWDNLGSSFIITGIKEGYTI